MSEAFEAMTAVITRAMPDATLRRCRPLTGGVSAAVFALDLVDAEGRSRTVVLRQQRPMAGKGADVERASDEFHLLRRLRDTAIPVPGMLYLDTGCELLPGPYALMEFVVGTTQIADQQVDASLAAMAETLAAIHDLPTADLLHGDFWPGNLLWRDGRLVAVLDWEDSAIGDPMADLAGARHELVWRFGLDGAEELTRRYAALREVDSTRLALWEVYVASAALRYMEHWRLPAQQEAAQREGAQDVVRRAAAVLGCAGDG